MEKLIREASKEDPDIGEQLNEQLDATAPILDSIQDTLAELDACRRERERLAVSEDEKPEGGRGTALRELHRRLDPDAPRFMPLRERAKSIRDLLDGLAGDETATASAGDVGTGAVGSGEVKPEATGKPSQGAPGASGQQGSASGGKPGGDASGVRFGGSERPGRIRPAAGERAIDKLIDWLVG
jgi:hypothetical protein